MVCTEERELLWTEECYLLDEICLLMFRMFGSYLLQSIRLHGDFSGY
jgi:hypothetical protein